MSSLGYSLPTAPTENGTQPPYEGNGDCQIEWNEDSDQTSSGGAREEDSVDSYPDINNEGRDAYQEYWKGCASGSRSD